MVGLDLGRSEGRSEDGIRKEMGDVGQIRKVLRTTAHCKGFDFILREMEAYPGDFKQRGYVIELNFYGISRVLC